MVISLLISIIMHAFGFVCVHDETHPLNDSIHHDAFYGIRILWHRSECECSGCLYDVYEWSDCNAIVCGSIQLHGGAFFGMHRYGDMCEPNRSHVSAYNREQSSLTTTIISIIKIDSSSKNRCSHATAFGRIQSMRLHGIACNCTQNNSLSTKTTRAMNNVKKKKTADWPDNIPNISNRELELRVLADLLQHTECWDMAMSQNITEDLFCDQVNARLYHLMARLKTEGESLDLIHFSEAVRAEDSEDLQARFMDVLRQMDAPSLFRKDVFVLMEKSIRRAIILACTDSLNHAQDQSMSVDETLETLRRDLDRISDSSVDKSYETLSTVIKSNIEKLRLYKAGVIPMGVPTGYRGLDTILNGFEPDDLVILAARPSVGKSAFALNICLNLILGGHKVAFFSLEMSNAQQGTRSLSYLSGVNGGCLRDQADLGEKWKLLEEVRDNPVLDNMFLDDTPALSTDAFAAKARDLVKHHGVQLIVVDYLQLMTVNPRLAVREQEVAAISRALKATAKALKIPIIALSQLSRNAVKSYGKPQLSDLRESGAIEQDADTVIFIHRPDFIGLSEDPADKNKAWIIIAKHRKGTLGEVEFTVNTDIMRFVEKLEDLPPTIEYNPF